MWEFGLNVIIIDYYDILFKLLFVNVIFNFKFIFEIFFYWGVVGVGVVYILVVFLVKCLEKFLGLINLFLELFILGIIVDLVFLIGVNCCWVKWGL